MRETIEDRLAELYERERHLDEEYEDLKLEIMAWETLLDKESSKGREWSRQSG